MLTILRKGVPVVSPAWVLACKEQEGLVDPWDYVLKDQFMEKLWDFNLQESLKKENKNVFKGYSIHVTKSVKPGAELFKDVIEHCGGKFLSNIVTSDDKDGFVISCLDDKEVFKKMKEEGVSVVSRDFLISAVLKQKLPEFKEYSL